MKELEQIVGVLRRAMHGGDRVLLATVVGSEGSTYRKVGARMIVTPDRSLVGAISGGCLEADIVERWDRLSASGVPELVTYDTRSREDLIWGLGLGCNGRVDVLLEPLVDTALAEVHECLARAVAAEAGALATIVATTAPSRVQLGTRLLVDGDGKLAASRSSTSELELEVDAMLAGGWSAIARSGAERRTFGISGGSIEVLWEAITPAPRLTVCGAGADAIPVSAWAAQLGWRVRLIDHRPSFALVDRFPTADAVILASPGSVAAVLADEVADAVVVMSHSFERDVEYLAAALASGAPYVGVLGPRARTERLVAELAARGSRVDEATSARLYAPIGVDLGAETPEEIALAIVCELMAVQRGRAAGSLREGWGRIHGFGRPGGGKRDHTNHQRQAVSARRAVRHAAALGAA